MISLAILAGGNSDRMGQDKGLKHFLGQPLILHIIKRLGPLTKDIFVVTNRPADYSFLKLPLYSDLENGFGPLGGVFTALSVSRHSIVAIAGCDMPFCSVQLYKYEKTILSSSGADMVIPTTPQGLEPLHAIYQSEACLPVIKSAIKAGERKLIGWFPHVKMNALTPEETEKITPHFKAFINLNTPEEFRKAERSFIQDSQC